MEIQLSDQSKICLTQLGNDRVKIGLWRPQQLRDGDGYLLTATTLMHRRVLEDFLRTTTRAEVSSA